MENKVVGENIFGKIDKVKMAIERLKTFEPPEGYYLAFSGGKDSQCIYHLAEMAGVKFKSYYNVTTIDPPELIYFIRKHYPKVIFDRPKIPFLTRLTKKGFPLRHKRWCCEEYKERGGHGRRVITGIRWQESSKRKNRRIVEQCYKDTSKTYINPIIDWTEKDVWKFLGGMPHCSLYDEGRKRIGCIMCPASKNRMSDAERWPKFKKLFEQAFEKLYENRIYIRTKTGKRTKKLDPAFSRWKSGKHMFEWWLDESRNVRRLDKNVLFE